MGRQRSLLGMDGTIATTARLAETEGESVGEFGFPMTPIEISEFEERSRRVEAIATRVLPKAEQVPGWAGAYVDQARGGVVDLHFTALAGEDRVRLQDLAGEFRINLRFETVVFSERELIAAQQEILRTWPARDVSWSSVAVSHRDNAVVVYVAAEDADKASKVLASYEPQELFRLGIEEPAVEAACTTRENCSSPMKAGIVIRKGASNGAYRCTMGFNVQVGSDEQFVTSGHCGWDGSNNWYHAGFGLIGAETATQYVNNGRDAMRVQMSDTQDSNLVYNLFNPVTSARNPVQGESMCASLGVSNSHSCGIVEVALTSWVGTNCTCTINGADASITLVGGDSGSPFFSSQAVGIGVGATESGKFARLGDVLTAWGITIRS
jgi:hypothetical protein